MSNVLPTTERHAVERRMRARFLFVGACVIAGGACVASLALLPALISVRIARAALEAPAQGAYQGDVSDDQAAAARARALVRELGPIAQATSSPTDALAGALAQKPANVLITSITYSAAGNTLILSGVSQERDAVSAFRGSLEATGRFSSVAVPVAALVGTQEGRFTVTLSGPF